MKLQKKSLIFFIVLPLLLFPIIKILASTDPTYKIAILPFNIIIDTNNLPAGINEQNIIRRSEVNRYRFQRALHTWFIKKSSKYSNIFQDVPVTNTLLTQMGLIDSIETIKSKNLCSALGVNAVIFGNVILVNQRETVGREVMKQIVGINIGPFTKISIDLNLYNSSGNVEWSKKYEDYRTTSPDVIIDLFLKKVYKTFPYKK